MFSFTVIFLHCWFITFLWKFLFILFMLLTTVCRLRHKAVSWKIIVIYCLNYKDGLPRESHAENTHTHKSLHACACPPPPGRHRLWGPVVNNLLDCNACIIKRKKKSAFFSYWNVLKKHWAFRISPSDASASRWIFSCSFTFTELHATWQSLAWRLAI